jgi:hypothetical protein
VGGQAQPGAGPGAVTVQAAIRQGKDGGEEGARPQTLNPKHAGRRAEPAWQFIAAPANLM